MTQKRFFFLVSGCIGIVLLILPTVPFFLLTVFCFANSSQKLHDWFIGTKMYRKRLEFFVRRKDMTRKVKASIPTSVISLMGLGFFFMARKALWIPCGRVALPPDLLSLRPQNPYGRDEKRSRPCLNVNTQKPLRTEGLSSFLIVRPG